MSRKIACGHSPDAREQSVALSGRQGERWRVVDRDNPYDGTRAKRLAYYQSEQWQEKKKAVLERAEGQCELCQNSPEPPWIVVLPVLQVHHLTYERWTKELLSDLVVLCELCHWSLHNWAHVEPTFAVL